MIKFKFLFLLLLSILSFVETFASDKELSPVVKVGVVLGQPPFSFKNKQGEVDGVSIKLWEKVAKKLGVKYEYHYIEGDRAILKLSEKVLDIVISPLSTKHKSMGSVSFSRPYFMNDTGMAIPSSNASSYRIFINVVYELLPFIFVFLLVSLIFFGVIFWCFERKSRQFVSKGFLRAVLSSTRLIIDSFLKLRVVQATTTTGNLLLILANFLLITLLLSFALGVMYKYTANLTIGSRKVIHELSEFNKKRISIVAGDANTDFLRSLGSNLVVTDTISQGLALVQKDKVSGFVGDYYLIKYFIQNKNYKDIKLSSIIISTDGYVFGYPKDSPWLSKIDSILVKFQDTKVSYMVCSSYIGQDDAAKCIF